MRPHNLFGPASLLGFLVSEAVLAASCYIVAVIFLIRSDPTVFLLHHWGLVRILVLTAGILLGFYLQDLYENPRVNNKILLVQQVCLVLGLAFLLQAALNYADEKLVLPRWPMMVGSLLALVALPAWRISYNWFLTSIQHGDRLFRAVPIQQANGLCQQHLGRSLHVGTPIL